MKSSLKAIGPRTKLFNRVLLTGKIYNQYRLNKLLQSHSNYRETEVMSHTLKLFK